MLVAPLPLELTNVIESHPARPSTTSGASITPAQNAYGSYATVLGTPTTFDCHEIEIEVHNISAGNGTATDSLTTIGIDRAGGTSYVDWIPDLLTSYAGSWGNAGGVGITYRFPLFVPAGSTIGAKGAINRATLGTQRVSVRLYGRPSGLLGRVGNFVRSFGATLAASAGTAVTAGTTSIGAYTQLGGALAAADGALWHWQVAMAPSNDSAQNNSQVAVSMALGSSTSVNRPVITSQLVAQDSTEANYACYVGRYALGQPGDLVFARGWSATATVAFTAIAYGVGG